jgi:lysophospholipid acyltransferase (LPLAT)-like uncharacterized protein
MSVVTRIARSRAAQESLGFLGASYLKLVRRTNRFSVDPPDAYEWLTPLRPFIAAMWHGQHLMVPFVRRPQDRVATMVSRRCGEGIVMLARLSGRPVVPTAVVTSRYLQFDSWDRASLGLPFGRGVMAFGEPITVARNLDPAGIEAARLRIEADLNAVHARAFAQVGRIDPVLTGKRAAAR